MLYQFWVCGLRENVKKSEILPAIQADRGNTAMAAMTRLGCIRLIVMNNTNITYKCNCAFIMLLLEVSLVTS